MIGGYPIVKFLTQVQQMNQDSNNCIYYLPIRNPDLILEGCETLLRTLIARIIERYYINGHSNYTNQDNVLRVKVTQLIIDYLD